MTELLTEGELARNGDVTEKEEEQWCLDTKERQGVCEKEEKFRQTDNSITS